MAQLARDPRRFFFQVRLVVAARPFGGGDAPADAAEPHDNGAGMAQNGGGEASSERKGLLSGTGYESNW